nr:MAG TPA: hypothetical protein [Caudoviricetes sp.]
MGKFYFFFDKLSLLICQVFQLFSHNQLYLF